MWFIGNTVNHRKRRSRKLAINVISNVLKRTIFSHVLDASQNSQWALSWQFYNKINKFNCYTVFSRLPQSNCILVFCVHVLSSNIVTPVTKSCHMVILLEILMLINDIWHELLQLVTMFAQISQTFFDIINWVFITDRSWGTVVSSYMKQHSNRRVMIFHRNCS